ncbi:uncharacterized protein TM35_000081180 [Trypanosoma theileri]|uniref:Uncharacterized protein n=1 Tax=Trypanosoma theileri TaxID=67003 RepID=A0A1X0P1P1_9TRYP|nr:uncharacterized protein TM35_000081180 [Trypanosoma theileri]ORC90320.1 hypothetical protein TM35_000081180 [Trypanosoma theileri]
MMQENVTFAQVVGRRASINPMEPNNVDSGSGSATTVNAGDVVIIPGTVSGANSTMSVRPPGGESYANAVKSQSVKLGGVPVNAFKVVGCVSSVTNSTMQEQESVLSSWADDDQCFFDSIRIAKVEDPKPRETRAETESDDGPVRIDGGVRRNRGGRGWKFIGRGGGSNNNHNHNNRRRRGYSGNQSHNSGVNFRGGSSAEPPVLSGGRFASLR